MIENWKLKIGNFRKGFTLIELLVAIFIFSVIVVGILSVFVSSTSAYSKARAIKTVKENIEYAESLIAKDVRMGKIENYYSDGNLGVGITAPFVGNLKQYFVVRRNRGGKVCYRLDSTGTKLGVEELTGTDADNNVCSADDDDYQELVDLANENMTFDTGTSGFRACPSTFGTPTNTCLSGVSENRRGWVEINLNVEMTSGQEMEADQINVQTTISSRDYGWEEVN